MAATTTAAEATNHVEAAVKRHCDPLLLLTNERVNSTETNTQQGIMLSLRELYPDISIMAFYQGIQAATSYSTFTNAICHLRDVPPTKKIGEKSRTMVVVEELTRRYHVMCKRIVDGLSPDDDDATYSEFVTINKAKQTDDDEAVFVIGLQIHKTVSKTLSIHYAITKSAMGDLENNTGHGYALTSLRPGWHMVTARKRNQWRVPYLSGRVPDGKKDYKWTSQRYTYTMYKSIVFLLVADKKTRQDNGVLVQHDAGQNAAYDAADEMLGVAGTRKIGSAFLLPRMSTKTNKEKNAFLSTFAARVHAYLLVESFARGSDSAPHLSDPFFALTAT